MVRPLTPRAPKRSPWIGVLVVGFLALVIGLGAAMVEPASPNGASSPVSTGDHRAADDHATVSRPDAARSLARSLVPRVIPVLLAMIAVLSGVLVAAHTRVVQIGDRFRPRQLVLAPVGSRAPPPAS